MSGGRFAEYRGLDLVEVNKQVEEMWREKDIFRRSIESKTGENGQEEKEFVFYEGPPSANGMPGIHHVIARTIKDLFCRYRTMKGFKVKRKAGWDTHGLPVELSVEKALGITKDDIGKKVSISDYNAACRNDVMRYTREWEELTVRMGYWVDMDDPYVTCNNRYIETLWYLLKRLYGKGLLYKGYAIQPFSPAAGTGLSTHELNQPGCYRDVKDTTCTAQFLILDPKGGMTGFGKPFFLAWTTTPWTLPSNTALCVGATITYVAVQTYNPYTGEPVTVVLAKNLLYAYFSPKAEELDLKSYHAGDKFIPYRVVGQWQGAELAGMHYEQLFPWVRPEGDAFRVITGDFVTTEEGTGIVHIAPTFGADDARVAKTNDIPPLMLRDKDGIESPMVDRIGRFFPIQNLDPCFVRECVDEVSYAPFAGCFVKNAYDPILTDTDETLDVKICMSLKTAGRAFRIEKHVHNYPHCWRTDKPVLYYPLDSWFIRTTACRDRMIELNNTIQWKPVNTGTGRFGKWLENLQDWNLSRSRYWGTPLPIWRADDGEERCIGSLEELYTEVEKAVLAGCMPVNPLAEKGFRPGVFTKENYDKIDLHRPFVDELILLSSKGKPMRREEDLIDVWFDSGAMPYAQAYYLGEKDVHKLDFPADFIAEGVDQTRGWFFTLHAIAVMAFDSVAFRTVVSNGLVLDKNGNKMSKRLANAIDPFKALDEYGADALRWYMITNASPWDNIKFDTDGVEEVRRRFFGTLYNTYSFFALYANVDGFTYQEEEIPLAERPETDRWIFSLLNTLIKNVDGYFADYEPTRAGRAIADFVNDNLSNWYVRLNRRRFWGGGLTLDKLSAYQTLYTCLETVARLMAPVAPFYAERLYLDLAKVTDKGQTLSVHLAGFPVCIDSFIDKDLEERMCLAQDLSSLVLALRRKVNIKVRQPLQTILVPATGALAESLERVKDLVLSEVNVKELRLVSGTEGVLVKKIKPDFRKLGPRYGKIMKSLSAALQTLSQQEINDFETKGKYTLCIEGQSSEIDLADVEIVSEDLPGWLVANDGHLTVALDVTLTSDLRYEGIARELVNRIQNLRKHIGLEITDRIKVILQPSPHTDIAVRLFRNYICTQVLADILDIAPLTEGHELDFDDYKLLVRLEKSQIL
ncbi:MAG: isoleucine--tRNA ligase [Tannerellaceae bacterium]|jgi:isoleucyl-tRNA synthetase|nr:isoleucine--tRNA ligase [Tannerellaceae bacterium]